MTRLELYQIACRTLRPLKLGEFGESGIVACALESTSGRVFTGICIDLPCALGFCAERAAAAGRDLPLAQLLPERWDKSAQH